MSSCTRWEVDPAKHCPKVDPASRTPAGAVPGTQTYILIVVGLRPTVPRSPSAVPFAALRVSMCFYSLRKKTTILPVGRHSCDVPETVATQCDTIHFYDQQQMIPSCVFCLQLWHQFDTKASLAQKLANILRY